MALPQHATLLERIWHYMMCVIAGLICIFLVAPNLIVIPLSFNSEPYFTFPMRGYSLRWYEALFSSEEWRRAALNSLIVATSTTVLATSLGAFAALGLHRAKFAMKGLVTGLLISPMILPVIITAVSIYFFMSTLDLVNTRLGLILAHVVLAAPFVVITVSATLSGLDMNLLRAAAGLGAGPLTVFFRVTMRLIMPGLVSGAIFALVTSLDDAVVSQFLTGPEQHTLPREMWKGIRQQINPVILSASSLLVLIALIVLAGMEWVRRYNSRMRGLKE